MVVNLKNVDKIIAYTSQYISTKSKNDFNTVKKFLIYVAIYKREIKNAVIFVHAIYSTSFLQSNQNSQILYPLSKQYFQPSKASTKYYISTVRTSV